MPRRASTRLRLGLGIRQHDAELAAQHALVTTADPLPSLPQPTTFPSVKQEPVEDLPQTASIGSTSTLQTHTYPGAGPPGELPVSRGPPLFEFGLDTPPSNASSFESPSSLGPSASIWSDTELRRESTSSATSSFALSSFLSIRSPQSIKSKAIDASETSGESKLGETIIEPSQSITLQIARETTKPVEDADRKPFNLPTRKTFPPPRPSLPRRTKSRAMHKDESPDDNYRSNPVLPPSATGKRGRKRKLDIVKLEEVPKDQIMIDAPDISEKPKRGRPAKKLKLSISTCICQHPHHESIQCVDSKIVFKNIISISDMVTIFVGKEKETFYAHRGLLKLYSGFFRRELDKALVDGKTSMSLVEPKLFEDFHSWICAGSTLSGDCPSAELTNTWIELWALGEDLEAATFQNCMFDKYRKWCQQSPIKWPSISGISLIYQLTKPRSQLRKFAAHSVACRHPLETHKEGSEEYKTWKEFFENCPDLVMDMVLLSKKWEGTEAWDNAHIKEYMVREESAESRWKQMILGENTEENLEKKANEGCRKSKVEFEHLERERLKEE